MQVAVLVVRQGTVQVLCCYRLAAMKLLRENIYFKVFSYMLCLSPILPRHTFWNSCLLACDFILLLNSRSLPVAYSPSSFASQYFLVYKGFNLHQDGLLYWQLPGQFTGDKVIVKTWLAPGHPLRGHIKYCTPIILKHSYIGPQNLCP